MPMTAPRDTQAPSVRETLARTFRRAMTEHMRAHTDGTNVNADTLLAADYLNQFHAVVMLLEALPGAGDDIVGELAHWRPADYADHFQTSGFSDRALAVAAYRNAPEHVRASFDWTIQVLAREADMALREVRAHLDAGDRQALPALCADAAGRLGGLLEEAALLVNGAGSKGQAPRRWGTRQVEVDAILAVTGRKIG